MGEPALPSCTFISAADGPLPVLEVGDVRLFSHEFDDGLLQAPAAIVSSPGSDLFCKRNGGHCQKLYPASRQRVLKKRSSDYFLKIGGSPERTIIALNADLKGSASLSDLNPSIRQNRRNDPIFSGFSRIEYLIGRNRTAPKAILRRGLPSGGPWRTDRLLGDARGDATRREAVSERLGSNL